MKNKITKGFASKDDMKKINLYSQRELNEDEVYIFTVSLCDNDVDRDFERFSLSALNELAELFVGKTGIFDHSMKSSDQKARIFEAFVEKTGGSCIDGEPLYALKARAYMLKNDENSALVEEIEAGIKKEVSVSCQMGQSICSICKKDNKKQPCEHIRGNSYNGELCFKTLQNAQDAYEFSFVAVPAQRKAGVTKAFKGLEEINMNEIVKSIKEGNEALKLSEAQVKSVADYILSLEEEAALGNEYKNQLMSEVTKLFRAKLPGVDSKLFASIVSVMTVKELLGFKRGLQGGAESTPQLMAKKETQNDSDYSQFRI